MNLFELPELPLLEELTTVLAENNNVRIERIVSTGQVSGWYALRLALRVLLIWKYTRTRIAKKYGAAIYWKSPAPIVNALSPTIKKSAKATF